MVCDIKKASGPYLANHSVFLSPTCSRESCISSLLPMSCEPNEDVNKQTIK